MTKTTEKKTKVTEEQKKIATELMQDFRKSKDATASLTIMAHAFCISPRYQALGAKMADLEKTIFDQFSDPAQVGPALSLIARAVLGIIYMDTLRQAGMDKEGMSMFSKVLTNGSMEDHLKSLNAANALFEQLGVKSPMADVFED